MSDAHAVSDTLPILAIDPGKYKSVACCVAEEVAKPPPQAGFGASGTGDAELGCL
jgi:hypothetical protein